MRRPLALILLCAAVVPVSASPHQTQTRNSSQTLRRRLFTNELITPAGGIDLELGPVWDSRGGYTLPTTLKFTPRTWRTELSAGADLITNGYVSLAATTAFGPTDNFNWAFAPVVTIFVDGAQGLRLGGTFIARYDRGPNSFSASASWSGATAPSPTNPSGLFDIVGGYARVFGKFTPYANTQLERASGIPIQYSVFEGVEWQVNRRLSFDLSGQHYAINSTRPDHRLSLVLAFSLK